MSEGPAIVAMGGRSLEREISLRSGHRVERALRSLGYKVHALDVESSARVPSVGAVEGTGVENARWLHGHVCPSSPPVESRLATSLPTRARSGSGSISSTISFANA